MAEKDEFTRSWIIENAVEIIDRYEPGELTLRALHYQLVGRGMTNSMQRYKRVVAAMEVARWDGQVDFETFSDLDREVVGATDAEPTNVTSAITTGEQQVRAWMQAYNKNRWENQPIYPELWIEKKALQSIFAPVTSSNDVGLFPVKGYPSLTALYEAAQRFKEHTENGKECVILYFGDYDPSGEDIPRSIHENLTRMGVEVDVRRFALFEYQVRDWKLPPAPTKETDSRTANWDGIGQVELDAVPLEQLRRMAQDAINSVFDTDLHAEIFRIKSINQTIMNKFPKFEDTDFDVDHVSNEVTAVAWGITGRADIPPREPFTRSSDSVAIAKTNAYQDLLVNIGVYRGGKAPVTDTVTMPATPGLQPEQTTRWRFKGAFVMTFRYNPETPDNVATPWEVPNGAHELYQCCPHCQQPGHRHGWIGQTMSLVCPGDHIAMLPDGTAFTFKPGALPMIATRVQDPMVTGWYWCKPKEDSAPRPLYWDGKDQLFYPYNRDEDKHGRNKPISAIKFHLIHQVICRMVNQSPHETTN